MPIYVSVSDDDNSGQGATVNLETVNEVVMHEVQPGCTWYFRMREQDSRVVVEYRESGWAEDAWQVVTFNGWTSCYDFHCSVRAFRSLEAMNAEHATIADRWDDGPDYSEFDDHADDGDAYMDDQDDYHYGYSSADDDLYDADEDDDDTDDGWGGDASPDYAAYAYEQENAHLFYDVCGNERSDGEIAEVKEMLTVVNANAGEELTVDEFDVLFSGKRPYGLGF